MSIIFSGRGRLQCFCAASSVFFHQVSLLQRRSLRPPPQCLSEQSWRESCRSSLTVPLSSLTPASPLCPHPPSRGSACPRNKVVPSNCSNGVLSSLDSWPWLCVIRVGQRGLEVPPQGLFNSPSHQSIPQIQFTPTKLECFAISNWAAFVISVCSLRAHDISLCMSQHFPLIRKLKLQQMCNC